MIEKYMSLKCYFKVLYAFALGFKVWKQKEDKTLQSYE